MTTNETHNAASQYFDLNIRNIYIFMILALVFGGWAVLSPDFNETAPYADLRKLAAIGYSMVSVILIVLTLKLMVRMNAALRLAQSTLSPSADGSAEAQKDARRLFRPISALWALFPMTAIMIVVNYIILIYAVDGGLF